jgi:hypothetical protein
MYFVKRWSELFVDASVPRERLPPFFKENTVFGEYPGVHFSADIALSGHQQSGERHQGCGVHHQRFG